jgi:hypothetical protein
VADPDPWRCRVRDALDLEPADRERTRAAFEELAATAPEDALHRDRLSRLAYALGRFGKKEKEMATSLLGRAQRAHPDDFWINYDLARSLMGTGRPDEAARFFTPAVAIRPGATWPSAACARRSARPVARTESPRNPRPLFRREGLPQGRRKKVSGPVTSRDDSLDSLVASNTAGCADPASDVDVPRELP